jgi:hypothetical protein
MHILYGRLRIIGKPAQESLHRSTTMMFYTTMMAKYAMANLLAERYLQEPLAGNWLMLEWAPPVAVAAEVAMVD